MTNARFSWAVTIFCCSVMLAMTVSASYTQFDSIKSDGNVWIYSGYRPRCTDRVEITFKVDKDETVTLYCARGNQTNKDTFSTFLVKQGNVYLVRFDRDQSTSARTAAFPTDGLGEWHTVIADGSTGEGTIDETVLERIGPATFTPGSAFSLFGAHVKGTALSESTALSDINNRNPVTLGSFKVYSSIGELVLDLVPARDETASDGTTSQYGLFDRVAKVFHKGLGTGVFTPGTQVGETGGLGEGVNVWNGSVSASWSDDGNWSSGSVPGTGAEVFVPAGKSLVLTNATANIASLRVAGTLTFSNEAARVSAETMTVANAGIVTCAAGEPVVDNLLTQRTHRVQIVCGDLDVQPGGKIDVSMKGWISEALPTGNSANRGYGPGSVPYTSCSTAHGGFGAMASIIEPGSGDDRSWPMPYDNPVLPTLPGSSGASSGWGRGGNGGGVVYISAAGSVVVNGSILADGGAYSGSYGSAGSGGAVSISCETLMGSGIISAAGGNGNTPTHSTGQPSLAAGGGCIAIRYDTAKQTSAQVSGMRITAADGIYVNDPNKSGRVGTVARGANPDLGTVWFSDDKIVRQLLGNGLMGQIKNVTNYTHTGDLVFAYGDVRFAEEGANVTVTGNLSIKGDDVRLAVGGCMATNRSMFADIWGGKVVNRLTVGGDLALSGISCLDIRAAETNGTDLFGAEVKVGGTLSIASNCFVYAWSDLRNAGAPHFEVGNLHVATGGVFSAAERGGSGVRYTGGVVKYSAYGNSSGKGDGAGGGHGGAGGLASKTVGCVSGDSPERPSMPGSGGGAYISKWNYGGFGGGVVFVTAANGTIRIDGKVTADGTYGYRYGGGGAGGTILLEAKSLLIGETGVVTAKGGETTAEDVIGGGAGGGGRIALWCGEQWTSKTPTRRCKDFSDNPTAHPDVFVLAGRVSADSGKNTGVASKGADGADGTVRYIYVDKAQGLMLILR